jgi:hypothetical protein
VIYGNAAEHTGKNVKYSVYSLVLSEVSRHSLGRGEGAGEGKNLKHPQRIKEEDNYMCVCMYIYIYYFKHFIKVEYI